MKQPHVLGVTIALGLLASVVPTTFVQAKTISQFTGDSLVYFDYTSGSDAVYASSQGNTISYTSDTPVTTGSWTLGDSWKNFNTTYSLPSYFNLPMYTTQTSPVTDKATLFQGQHYFAVNVQAASDRDIGTYAVEVWRVANLGDTPQRVASFTNSHTPSINSGSLFILNDTIYLIDDMGDVYSSTDGSNWDRTYTPDNLISVWDIAASDSKMYIATDDGILKSVNGRDWDSVSAPFVTNQDYKRIQNLAVSADDTTLLATYADYVDGPVQLYRRTNGEWNTALKSKYGFADLAVNGDRLAVSKRQFNNDKNSITTLTGNSSGSLTAQKRINTDSSYNTIISAGDYFLSLTTMNDGYTIITRNR